MTKYGIPPYVHFRRLASEVMLLDDRTDAYFGLNESAALIWAALAEGRTLEDAVDDIVDRSDVVPEIARTDAKALIAQLIERGLLEIVET